MPFYELHPPCSPKITFQVSTAEPWHGVTNVKDYHSPIDNETFWRKKGGRLDFIPICFFMARQPILGQGLLVV